MKITPSKSTIKVVSLNVLILFTIINVLIWIVPIQRYVKGIVNLAQLNISHKYKLPNYENIDWAKNHFAEMKLLKMNYASYVGWRHENAKFSTITIDGPYNQRSTVNHSKDAAQKVYFFGGSTIWGTGSDDANTIPSLYSKFSGLHTENFAESGYSSHQSLMMLIRLLQDGHKPQLVVFYDGANDIPQKCNSQSSPHVHAAENRIASTMREASNASYSFTFLFSPFLKLAKSLARGVFGESDKSLWYDCSTNLSKAEKVADNLLNDWRMAALLTESYGGKFLGILQPIAYTSKTRLSHLSLMESRGNQYDAVYPIVQRKMTGDKRFVDLTDLLDRDEYLYIDYCHLSPNGNRIMAHAIHEAVSEHYPDVVRMH
jgi:lysophospholipase L1-like esterase